MARDVEPDAVVTGEGREKECFRRHMLDLKWQEMQWLTVASAAGDPDLALSAATSQHQVSDAMSAWLTLALMLRRNDRA